MFEVQIGGEGSIELTLEMIYFNFIYLYIFFSRYFLCWCVILYFVLFADQLLTEISDRVAKGDLPDVSKDIVGRDCRDDVCGEVMSASTKSKLILVEKSGGRFVALFFFHIMFIVYLLSKPCLQ